MGEPAFGIAPGEAELWVSLRAMTDEDMATLLSGAMALAETEANAAGLQAGAQPSRYFRGLRQ